LTIQTWGKIKEVFRSEIPDYFDEEGFYRYQLYGGGDGFHWP